jgi:hypothetical protein
VFKIHDAGRRPNEWSSSRPDSRGPRSTPQLARTRSTP